jgi:spore maturation protein CgeB
MTALAEEGVTRSPRSPLSGNGAVSASGLDVADRRLHPSSALLLVEDYERSYTKAARELRAAGARSYDQLMHGAFARQIYYGDAYLNAFAAAGVDAAQVVPASVPFQEGWAAEHAIRLYRPTRKRPLRWCWSRRGRPSPWDRAMTRVLDSQVAAARPDLLWVFSGVRFDTAGLNRWREHTGAMLLWWSCPIEEGLPYHRFDLVLSCIPPMVETFRARGVHAEHMAHAFDERILGLVEAPSERRRAVAFVGNLTRAHGARIEFLDALSRAVEVHFYGDGIDLLPSDSPLRRSARPSVWGLDLYRIYASYAVVVHKNIDVAGPAASAKRLFEATGMGACLLAEESAELPGHFRPGQEVIPYRTVAEAIDGARALLSGPALAENVGRAGQRRTLADHTYPARIRQLLGLVRALA